MGTFFADAQNLVKHCGSRIATIILFIRVYQNWLTKPHVAVK